MGADDTGSVFEPPCVTSVPCNTAGVAQDWLNPAKEQLVYNACIPVETINNANSRLVPSLKDNTLYHVMVVPADLEE